MMNKKLLKTIGLVAILLLAYFAIQETQWLSITALWQSTLLVLVLAILVWKKKEVAITLLVLSIPYETLSLLSTDLPTLRIYQVLTVLLILQKILKTSRKDWKKHLSKHKTPLIIALILLGLHALGLRITSTGVIAKYGIILAIYIGMAAILTAEWKKNSTALKKTFYISAIPVMLLGIIQNAIHLYNINIPTQEWVGRPYGTFQEAAWLGMFLAFTGALLINDFYKRKQQWYYPYLVLYLITIIITVSRSSWLSLIVIIGLTIISAFIQKTTSKKKIATTTLSLLVMIFCLGVVVQQIGLTQFNVGTRFMSMITMKETYLIDGEKVKKDEESIKSRKQALIENWDLYKQHPITGTGFGSIEELKQKGSNESSLYFQILLSTGIIGGISTAYLVIHIYKKRFWKYAKVTAILGTTSILIGIMAITNVFEAGLFLGFFWLGIGVIFSKP